MVLNLLPSDGSVNLISVKRRGGGMQLEDYISKEHLKIYTDVLKLKPEEALGGYNWNKALSAAMQPLMHCLEVTLRNAIDCAIRYNPPPGAAGQWRTDTYWIYDLPRYMGDKTYVRQGKRFKTDRQENPGRFRTAGRCITLPPGKRTAYAGCQSASKMPVRTLRPSV